MSADTAASFISSDETRSAALRTTDFEQLVMEYGLDEVRVALSGLRDDLSAQLAVKSGDREWRARAGHLVAKVDARLRQTKALITARNRAESATVEAVEAKWSAFADRLARELYLRDPYIMRGMEGPTDDIDAAEWILARVEQRARKAAPVSSREGTQTDA